MNDVVSLILLFVIIKSEENTVHSIYFSICYLVCRIFKQYYET